MIDALPAGTPALSSCSPDVEIHRRVAAEFREMPGLRLTLSQAARLFCLDAGQCGRVLEALVGRGLLLANAGVFQSAGSGRRHV